MKQFYISFTFQFVSKTIKIRNFNLVINVTKFVILKFYVEFFLDENSNLEDIEELVKID